MNADGGPRGLLAARPTISQHPSSAHCKRGVLHPLAARQSPSPPPLLSKSGYKKELCSPRGHQGKGACVPTGISRLLLIEEALLDGLSYPRLMAQPELPVWGRDATKERIWLQEAGNKRPGWRGETRDEAKKPNGFTHEDPISHEDAVHVLGRW